MLYILVFWPEVVVAGSTGYWQFVYYLCVRVYCRALLRVYMTCDLR